MQTDHRQATGSTSKPTSGGGAPRGLTRRQLLVAGGAGAGALALGGILSACGGSSSPAGAPAGPVDLTIRAMRSEVEIGGRRAATWTYGGALPGREVRLTQGKPVRIKLINDLPEPTSIHWHGIRLRNEADGVPGFTQDAVKPGGEFIYAFTPPDEGTYMLHSHSGTQLDRGLSAALIVEPRREELSYDREAVLMFDDWTDGLAPSPDQRLAALQSKGMGMGMGGGKPAAGAGATPRHTDISGGAPGPDSLASMANALAAGRLDPGDIRDYPLFLVNGRPPQAPETVAVSRGDRVRLRLVNPSADTMYCVWVEDHELEIVRADGPAVRPVKTDAVVLGMGERYDAMVTIRHSGFTRIIGMPLGKHGRAVALLRTKDATGRAPAAAASFKTPRRVLSYGDLQPVGPAGRALSATPRVIRLDLAMGHGQYVWTIGGQTFDKADTIKVGRGEHIRFAMTNRSMMPHPMHLHGHDVAVNGIAGPRKDTALAIPMRELTFDWIADNPGAWAFHCHNVYHQAAGMMRKVEVS